MPVSVTTSPQKSDFSLLLPLTSCELPFNLHVTEPVESQLECQPVQLPLHLQDQPNLETPNSGFSRPGSVENILQT
jgi:hypothetical protein